MAGTGLNVGSRLSAKQRWKSFISEVRAKIFLYINTSGHKQTHKYWVERLNGNLLLA